MATRNEAGAIVLAGGQSRRMGRNKALLPFQNRPLIQHITDQLRLQFPEILISTNTPELFHFLDFTMVPDQAPDQGPLMGIASALRCSHYPWNLVLATDMPDPPLHLLPDFFARIDEAPCVIARSQDNRLHPLFGLYHRDLAVEILSYLASGERRVLTFVDGCRAATVAVPTDRIRNLNTPADVQREPGSMYSD